MQTFHSNPGHDQMMQQTTFEIVLQDDFFKQELPWQRLSSAKKDEEILSLIWDILG